LYASCTCFFKSCLLSAWQCCGNTHGNLGALNCLAWVQFHPGNNVGLGRDYTIYSLIDGVVKFEKFGPDRKKVMSAWTHTHTLSLSLSLSPSIHLSIVLSSLRNLVLTGRSNEFLNTHTLCACEALEFFPRVRTTWLLCSAVVTASGACQNYHYNWLSTIVYNKCRERFSLQFCRYVQNPCLLSASQHHDWEFSLVASGIATNRLWMQILRELCAQVLGWLLYTLISTHCQEMMKSVGSHGS
jgi:hypothetical protein